MNLANGLTLLRICAIPLLLVLLSLPHVSDYQKIIDLLIFFIIAFTDYLDGFIARKYKQETNIGQLLDPLADKMLVFSLLLWFIAEQKIAYYWVAILLFRELAVLGLRSIAALQKVVIKADQLGKIKTVWQYVTLAGLSWNYRSLICGL